MTASKLARSKKKIGDILATHERTGGYTPKERETLIQYALQHGGNLIRARRKIAAQEQAEAFRRRLETIWIFRGLPEIYRKKPCSQATTYKVRNKLEKIGITVSERTLMRDYRAIGGAKLLRNVKPFAADEDASSPFLDVTAIASS